MQGLCCFDAAKVALTGEDPPRFVTDVDLVKSVFSSRLWVLQLVGRRRERPMMGSRPAKMTQGATEAGNGVGIERKIGTHKNVISPIESAKRYSPSRGTGLKHLLRDQHCLFELFAGKFVGDAGGGSRVRRGRDDTDGAVFADDFGGERHVFDTAF